MTATVLAREEKELSKVVGAVQELTKGRSNATGAVTLTANATTTVVTAMNCGADSYPFLIPLTANAAAALATTYVSAVANGSFTLTHANNSQTDKEFGFVCLG
jgi:hypothetical protein